MKQALGICYDFCTLKHIHNFNPDYKSPIRGRHSLANGTNKVVLTQKERASLELQLGIPIRDMHDAKKYMKANDLSFDKPGGRSPSKTGQTLFSSGSQKKVDIHELHRKIRSNHGNRSR